MERSTSGFIDRLPPRLARNAARMAVSTLLFFPATAEGFRIKIDSPTSNNEPRLRGYLQFNLENGKTRCHTKRDYDLVKPESASQLLQVESRVKTPDGQKWNANLSHPYSDSFEEPNDRGVVINDDQMQVDLNRLQRTVEDYPTRISCYPGDARHSVTVTPRMLK